MEPSAGGDGHFLDGREQALLAEVLAATEGTSAAQRILAELAQLRGLARATRESPEIFPGARDGLDADTTREGAALLEGLCATADYEFDLRMPTKAVLGQAYLVAKINFLRALRDALDGEGVAAPAELRERVEGEVGQSVYSKMAEEVFVAIVTDAQAARDVRLRAARLLLRIWEERLLTEIDDFAPLLESAWEARNRVRPRLGTMMGTEELVRLFQQARDDRFLSYFGRDETSEDELHAFEEFLFGLSHEHIDRLRRSMSERRVAVVSPADACAILSIPPDAFAQENAGPDGLYGSYRRRQLKARYRVLTSAPGPKRTAEEYMLAAYLAGALG
jgi:hypothetical protein